MKKILAFEISGILSLALLYFVPYIAPYAVIWLYINVSLVHQVPFYKFIRKHYFAFFYREVLVNLVGRYMGDIAYPLSVDVNFNHKYRDKFVEMGNTEAYTAWFGETIKDKGVEIINNLANALMGKFKEQDEYADLDPETRELMKQAHSEEYESIADAANTKEWIEKHTNTWTLEDEQRRRDSIMNDLRLWGNEAGKQVLREMEEEDRQAENLINEAKSILGDKDFDEQI